MYWIYIDVSYFQKYTIFYLVKLNKRIFINSNIDSFLIRQAMDKRPRLDEADKYKTYLGSQI